MLYTSSIMWAISKKPKGFTIVELFIVIVVIGILAAISIVTYTSTQQRGKNAQTTQALTSWMKALNRYKTDKGMWPKGSACLGTGYKYNLSGVDSSGYGQCRQSGANAGVTESLSFNTLMQPYVGSTPLPTPAFVTTRNTETEWLRGITYVFGGGADNPVYVQAVYAGQIGSCPTITDVVGTYSTWDAHTTCRYQLGRVSGT